MDRIKRRKPPQLTAEKVLELLKGTTDRSPKSIHELLLELNNQYTTSSMRRQLMRLVGSGQVDRVEVRFRGGYVRWGYWLKQP